MQNGKYRIVCLESGILEKRKFSKKILSHNMCKMCGQPLLFLVVCGSTYKRKFCAALFYAVADSGEAIPSEPCNLLGPGGAVKAGKVLSSAAGAVAVGYTRSRSRSSALPPSRPAWRHDLAAQ